MSLKSIIITILKFHVVCSLVQCDSNTTKQLIWKLMFKLPRSTEKLIEYSKNWFLQKSKRFRHYNNVRTFCCLLFLNIWRLIYSIFSIILSIFKHVDHNNRFYLWAVYTLAYLLHSLNIIREKRPKPDLNH